MKKGEIYEGVIEKVEFPNKGFVYVDGQKVIVKNGIPGQRIRFMINKSVPEEQRDVFSRYWKSRLLRQESRCAVFFLPAAAVCIRRWLMKISFT